MVRYWCNACGTEHDNARECTQHVSMRGSAQRGKKQDKIRDDFNRRKGMKNNDASKDMGSGCAVVTLIGLALTVYGAVLSAQWGYELVALVLR